MHDPAGKAAEELVERICTDAFFADFVIRDPKYKNPSGKELEAADILVLFGDQAVSIQVKARPKSRKDSETEDVYFGRLKKRIDQGASQVPTLLRAFRNGGLSEVTTARGLTIPVNPEEFRQVRGVVVLDLPGERSYPSEARTVLYSGVVEKGGIAVHSFLSDEFEVMLQELDTLPDFLDYLDFRERMFGAERIPPLTHNLDLLATYKMYPEVRNLQEPQRIKFLVIDGCMWEHYIAEHQEAREQRRIADEPSKFVDDAIDFLHRACTGREQQYRDDWLRMARELAGFTRIQRRKVRKSWRDALKRAETKGEAFSFLLMEGRPSEGLLLYGGPTEARTDRLHMLAAAAYVRFDLRRVVALGASPSTAKRTSMQMVALEQMQYAPDLRDELREMSEGWFGSAKYSRAYEYVAPKAPVAAPPMTQAQPGRSSSKRRRARRGEEKPEE